MKRVLLLLLAVVLALALCSCSVLQNAGKIVSAIKSAAAEVSTAPEDVTESTPAPEPTPAAPEITSAPQQADDAAAPGATVTPSAAGDDAGIPAFWAKDIPSTVPVFNYGDSVKQAISETTSNGLVTFSAGFSNVTQAQIDGYLQKLKAAGYTVSTTTDKATGVSNVAMLMDESNIAATVVVTLTPDGICGFAVVFSAK